MEPAIEVKNLNYTYADGTKALNGISFAIEKHKKVALLGENGSGKSTLILHLNGLHRPTTGQIRVLGLSVDDAHIDTVRTKVGMIFQNPDDQIFAPTVYQDVAFGLRNLGFSELRVARMVGEMLDLLGIAHLKHKAPDKLSGGEKRRVALAGILVMNPEIIVLDEPHSGLDPNGHLELNDLLDELHSKGRTMIVATHDVEFVASWADEILIMKDGKIIAHGSPYDVFSDLTMLREANLKLPTVISIYNELKSRNFVFRGDEIPLDTMDLVNKVESPNIKFLRSSNALNKGTIVGIEYSGESWAFSAHKGKGKILTYDDDIAVVELLDGSLPSYGDITIFKVHDDERYDALVAERVKAAIEDGANRAQNIKIGAM